jgi:Zn-dependent protease with chaperone function
MTFPYMMRLWCLCLASFFLLNLALGLSVSLVTPWVIRAASRMEARLVARLLLSLRLLPVSLAALLVAGVCAPSYLWLEPTAGSEEVGWGGLLPALFGLAALGESLARAFLAYRRSNRYVRQSERRGRKALLRAARMPVWLVDGVVPLVALTGILRPRLMMSQQVMRALSQNQLAAVLRHEHAHRISRDNLKRLLILLSPGMLPFYRGLGALDRAWALAAEWAADARATEGNRRRALCLASALVRVARLDVPQSSPLLGTLLLANGAELSSRVDRLLHPVPRREETPASPILKAAASLTLAAGMAGVMLQPAMFHSVHELLEDLIR